MVELLGLPPLASEHGGRIDDILGYMHILMLLIFLGWGILFVYMLYRFRKKKQPQAQYQGLKSHASSYVEVVVVVAEAILLVGFSIPFWAAEVDAFPQPEDNPFEVRVVAQQFAWNVHYPGKDGVFGRVSADLVDEIDNPLGIDYDDPNAQDDITSFNMLRVPKGRQVLVHLTSKDVIHSFFLPELRVKHDAIPGMRIPVQFTPTMTTDELREITGDGYRSFEIACAQLCGITHYLMKGTLLVKTEAEIQEWFDEQYAE